MGPIQRIDRVRRVPCTQSRARLGRAETSSSDWQVRGLCQLGGRSPRSRLDGLARVRHQLGQGLGLSVRYPGQRDRAVQLPQHSHGGLRARAAAGTRDQPRVLAARSRAGEQLLRVPTAGRGRLQPHLGLLPAPAPHAAQRLLAHAVASRAVGNLRQLLRRRRVVPDDAAAVFHRAHRHAHRSRTRFSRPLDRRLPHGQAEFPRLCQHHARRFRHAPASSARRGEIPSPDGPEPAARTGREAATQPAEPRNGRQRTRTPQR